MDTGLRRGYDYDNDCVDDVDDDDDDDYDDSQGNYDAGQNLLRQIAKMPIFSCHPGKN